MGLDKKLELFAEMTVLAAVMFLAAFFCFRTVLLPKANVAKIDRIYEVEKILSEKR